VRYASSGGIGSANHLFGELLKIEGQATEHDHIPYRGSGPAIQDIRSQIDTWSQVAKRAKVEVIV
jgi:tripartite-type tricarboxylate transporter receptor subunit TctC